MNRDLALKIYQDTISILLAAGRASIADALFIEVADMQGNGASDEEQAKRCILTLVDVFVK